MLWSPYEQVVPPCVARNHIRLEKNLHHPKEGHRQRIQSNRCQILLWKEVRRHKVWNDVHLEISASIWCEATWCWHQISGLFRKETQSQWNRWWVRDGLRCKWKQERGRDGAGVSKEPLCGLFWPERLSNPRISNVCPSQSIVIAVEGFASCGGSLQWDQKPSLYGHNHLNSGQFRYFFSYITGKKRHRPQTQTLEMRSHLREIHNGSP